MTGINLGELEQLLIKKNRFLRMIKKEKNKLISLDNSLADCYDGAYFDSLYFTLKQQSICFDKIDSLLDSYLILLETVKNTYISQDSLFGEYINDNIKKM